MKKLALLVLGFLLGFVVCYYLFDKESIGDGEENPVIPKGIISPKIATQLDTTYNRRHAIISKYLGFEDNRSSWYSLDDLNSYLSIAEGQAEDLGYTMDGVRIYLGVKEPSGQEKHAYTTMFFVPTGTLNKSKGSVINSSLILQPGTGDIPGGSGLDYGEIGDPPNANYPQGNN